MWHLPDSDDVVVPTTAFRRASWLRFQLSLDPLGEPRRLPDGDQAPQVPIVVRVSP
jgi:hypothetical protein